MKFRFYNSATISLELEKMTHFWPAIASKNCHISLYLGVEGLFVCLPLCLFASGAGWCLLVIIFVRNKMTSGELMSCKECLQFGSVNRY